MHARHAHRRLTTTLASGMLLTLTLTGCSNDPLSASCEEFMEMSEAEQTDIVTEWNAEAVGDSELAEIGGSTQLPMFQEYCGDPANADDKIRDLQWGV